MLILFGASASGKTEVAKDLVKNYGFKKLITYTTRNMRIGEANGVDYHFIKKEEFLKLKEEGFFFETAMYNDNYYGTAIKDISPEKVVILEPKGVRYYLEHMRDRVYVIYLDSTEENRLRRMLERGDGHEKAEERIRLDRQYFSFDDIKDQIEIIDSNDITIRDLTKVVFNAYQRRA